MRGGALTRARCNTQVIRLWDLETFTCVEQTAPEAAVVRNIAFHKGGKYIFSVLQVGVCRCLGTSNEFMAHG